MPDVRRVPTTPSGQAARGVAAPGRIWLVFVGAAYLFFVVYGSLVPLNFHPIPMEAALKTFSAIPYLHLGIDSRADWVANALLFVPLAYLWSGVCWPRRSGVVRVLAGVLIGLACLALAVGIEFTQIFFPGRTVSINDIVAEGIGGVTGVWLWALTGARFRAWFGSMPLVQGTAGVAERLLIPYLLVMLGYNLLPLDLTLSPVELYHKWNEGRILLIPFGAHYDDAAHQYYDLLSDIAIWIPAALLWKLAYRQPKMVVWIYVVITATVIEFLQLFVYSRVSDTTDIITAAIGGVIGTALAVRGAVASRGGDPRKSVLRGSTRAWMAVAFWLCVLATVFWYPFDFNFDRAFLRERLIHLKQVPFEAYYFGSEFRAVTEVLHKTGFMLPLGVLLAIVANRSTPGFARAATHLGAVGFIIATAVGIEFGQLFLPDKNADITDALLETMGGLAGYWGCLFTIGMLNRPSGDGRE